MRLNRTPLAIAAVAALALLTACSTEGDTTPSETPEESSVPVPTEPTLRVPEVTSAANATLEVSAGDVDEPTAATIYRYDAEDWDTSAIDCTAAPDDTYELTLPEGGEWQELNVPLRPGIVSWVLVTDDYATPCGDGAALTRVLVETDVDVYLDSEASPTAGAPVTVNVLGSDVAPSAPTQVEVSVLGPWADRPSAQSASCDDEPVQTGEVTLEPGGYGPSSTSTEFQLDEPGVYLLVATAAETEQSSAYSTCTDAVDTDDLFSVGAP